MDTVSVYDTTLRDGSQREGISFSISDKIEIARLLDDLGVDYIEGGWPGSNPKDMEFFRRLKELSLQGAKVVAFGSTRHAGIEVGADANVRSLLEAGTPAVTIVGKCWDFHATHVLGTTLEENLSMIFDTVSFLKSKHREVFFDAEHFFDGFKNNPDYALKTLEAAAEGGADVLVLCDTNGGALPLEVQKVVKEVKSRITTPLGIHAHNDCGMAVANSLIALQSGAVHVQGTINGYGERCGNADLCTLIPNLQFKLGISSFDPEKLRGLTRISKLVAELANMIPQDNQPFVGRNAFTHKGGVHVSAVAKHARSYEHADPEEVGNRRRFLISELSGKGNILLKARENGLRLTGKLPEAREVLKKLKEMEHQGYQFEGAEGSFDLLVWKSTKAYKPLFELEGFRVIVDKQRREEDDLYVEATIKLKVEEQTVHTAAEGNGPVNAMDKALRKALEEIYPELKEIKLVDYKVRVLDGKDGTAAKVRVLTTFQNSKKKWGTVGVSENIIAASWIALVDGIEYGLICDKRLLAEDKKAEDIKQALKEISWEEEAL